MNALVNDRNTYLILWFYFYKIIHRCVWINLVNLYNDFTYQFLFYFIELALKHIVCDMWGYNSSMRYNAIRKLFQSGMYLFWYFSFRLHILIFSPSRLVQFLSVFHSFFKFSVSFITQGHLNSHRMESTWLLLERDLKCLLWLKQVLKLIIK